MLQHSCVLILLSSVSRTLGTVHVFGVGWGGGANKVQVQLHTHVMLRYRSFILHLHTHVMLRWGGVGGLITFKYSCAHPSFYAPHVPLALAHTHTRHATLPRVPLALAHTRHATLPHVPLALAHTHTSCYATARSSCTGTHTHTSCYATARSSCTGTHTNTRHATLHRWKRFSVRSVVHKKSEWTKKCTVKGKAKWAGTQVLDRSWMWLKKNVPHSSKNRNDKVINPRLWEYIYQFVYRHNKKD